jgi:DNA-binding NarL/FixJ family response regulator
VVEVRTLESALELLGAGVVLLSGRATRAARSLLDAYFGAAAGDELPAAVATWLRRDASEPLVVSGESRRLVVRLVPGDPAALLLAEEPTCVPEAALVPLGLTPREREVLALLTRGGRNAEIALALGVTLRTVHKHLEQIYEKLGVGTRSAAVARAFEVAAQRR